MSESSADTGICLVEYWNRCGTRSEPTTHGGQVKTVGSCVFTFSTALVAREMKNQQTPAEHRWMMKRLKKEPPLPD